MARNLGASIPEDDFAPAQTVVFDSAAGGEDEVDARLLDLEHEPEPPFHRARKRVPVRRGPLPGKAAHRVKLLGILLLILGAIGLVLFAAYRYAARAPRFRLNSSDDIEVIRSRHVSRAQILQVMGGDIGRNVFFIPLEDRRRQLEELAWVKSAAISRLLPHRIRVEVHERVPVAFVRQGSRIRLIDAEGVLMDLPPSRPGGKSPLASSQYSFPVVVGMGEAEPLSTRAAQMQIYAALVHELDSGGAHYSQDLNEVDLSDPEDVKISTSDSGGVILIHLGSSNFLDRYRIYIANVKQWRQQYPNLHSVDLRYDRQVILNPDEPSAPAAPAVVSPKRTPHREAPVPAHKTRTRRNTGRGSER